MMHARARDPAHKATEEPPTSGNLPEMGIYVFVFMYANMPGYRIGTMQL